MEIPNNLNNTNNINNKAADVTCPDSEMQAGDIPGRGALRHGRSARRFFLCRCMAVFAFLAMVSLSHAGGTSAQEQPPVSEEPPIEEEISVELEEEEPEDAEALQQSERRFRRYAGRTISAVRIRVLEVFGPTIADTSETAEGRIEHALNTLHMKSRTRAIRDNLLFTEGSRVDPFLLADSERILRERGSIEDARITLTPDRRVRNAVQVLVTVKDRWSLGLSGEAERGNRYGLRLSERNFIGLGHRASGRLLVETDGPTRLGFGLGYTVENLYGSFISLTSDYTDLPGEETLGLRFDRELTAPSLKYVGGVELRTASIGIEEETPCFADHGYNLMELWAGRTIRNRLDERVLAGRRNLVLAAGLRRIYFTRRPSIAPDSCFRYHDRSDYLTSLSLIRRRYYRTNLLFSYGRAEDIPYGYLARFTTGMVDDSFQKRWYTGLTLTAGTRSERFGYGAGEIDIGGFPGGGRLELGALHGKGLWFSNILRAGDFRVRQFFEADYFSGIHRFGDETIDFLEGETIRGVGYTRAVTGTQRLLIRLETVAFTPWRAAGFAFSLYSFADVDFIGSHRRNIFSQDVYSGLGFGVRTRSPALGIGAIQFQLSWYPRLPVRHDTVALDISGERRYIPLDFLSSRPEVLEL